MTGKEYLIGYIQNHSGEEIYDLIKKIEYLTYEYTDSREAFISFLNDQDTFNLFSSTFNFREIIQNEYGNWVVQYGNTCN